MLEFSADSETTFGHVHTHESKTITKKFVKKATWVLGLWKKLQKNEIEIFFFKIVKFWHIFEPTLDAEGQSKNVKNRKSRDLRFVGRQAPKMCLKNRGIVYSTLWPIADLADFGPYFGTFFSPCQWDLFFFLIKKVKKRRFWRYYCQFHAIQMIT